MSEPDTRFDVAVIGAGPAGAATALSLARAGAGVLLLERSAFEAPRVGETLAPSVQPLLVRLGIWDRFRELHPLPSWGTRSIWGGPRPQERSHLMSPYGCGWHVDRQRFDRMLSEAAVAAGATLRTRTRLLGCVAEPGGWRLIVAGGGQSRALAARVLIDATGRSAAVGRRLGARRLVFDQLVGVTTQFARVPGDQQGYTLVEAAADGWWYSAPVGGDRLMAMLMTDGDLCRRAGLTSLDRWRARLRGTEFTGARVDAAPRAWGPRIFGAATHRLRRHDIRARWLAVGDAVLAVDPASGSGVGRALTTAQAGALVALALLDSAPADAIEAYEADRDRECLRYLEERAAYYRMEGRWPDAPFWRRRARDGDDGRPPRAIGAGARRVDSESA